MRIKSSKEKRILTIKTACRWLLYIILILFCFTIMNAGTHLHPLLLIPVAICISTYTGEIQAAATGAGCGFLLDISCGKLFGYNAVILCFFCVVVSLLYKYLLRHRFINTIIIIAATTFIQGYLDFKFYYDIWGYDKVNLILKEYTLPICIYTIISSIVIYGVVELINLFLLPKRHLTIEEAIKSYEE